MTKALLDLSSDQKISLIWRAVQTGLLLAVGIISNGVFQTVSKTSAQITQQSQDIAKITYQFEAIKETAKTDKADLLRQIDGLDKRLQSLRDEGSQDRGEVNKLRTDVALLKQKVQLQ